MTVVRLSDYIAEFTASPLAEWRALPPWELTAQGESIVRRLIERLPADEYLISEHVAIHRTAVIETGAVIKGALILGADCFVAASAYLRGSNWLARGVTLGPGVEVKSSFVFAHSTLAHFNFVGDSILGSGVNLEAGSVVCNHRNERSDAAGVTKFGALIGDGSRVGANAVLAPRTLLRPRSIVPRLALVDQDTAATAAQDR
jgi:UDP-N-acetylglucosamine diphosphorylase / glucose-1-phosphate thymidylyltransferase / UDP-N-acetylgalactosamine diphosphorylase / glucosamine-1-phosphate N-acetyltransferase / galactosamine-1-phosphate N-acetyltransferase